MKTEQEFENEVAAALGDRYVWALHTEPVKIVMRLFQRERELLEYTNQEFDKLLRNYEGACLKIEDLRKEKAEKDK